VIEVVDDPAAAAADRLSAATGNVVITGGSTPRKAYELVAEQRSSWDDIELWFSDERCVPADHEHSNYAMASKALGRTDGLHRMCGELGPGRGAATYEEELRSQFGDELPRFDLMLLGLGPDAHTCSLFPGDDALGERERWVVGVDSPGMAPLVARITLTLPVVNAARELIFLVTGEEKADAVARCLSGRADPGAPGSLVEPEGSVTWLLDAAAAARVEGHAR
jgi:6-phosphogluconolactonase